MVLLGPGGNEQSWGAGPPYSLRNAATTGSEAANQGQTRRKHWAALSLLPLQSPPAARSG